MGDRDTEQDIDFEDAVEEQAFDPDRTFAFVSKQRYDALIDLVEDVRPSLTEPNYADESDAINGSFATGISGLLAVKSMVDALIKESVSRYRLR